MAKLAIRGHKKRGKEVIGILEILGGSNAWGYIGNNTRVIYYIDETYEKFIACSEAKKDCECITFTLEEFLEKFPYKVGDKVIDKTDKCIGIVTEMHFEKCNSSVIYGVTFGNGVDFAWRSARSLQPYKEETMDKAVFDANAQCCDITNRLIKKEIMEEIKVDIPKGYEFAGVDDDNQQVVFTKIGYHYPKTYEECCKVLGYSGNYNMILTTDVDNKLFNALYRLKVCRDAYWKIAGEQLGLGKPWEPDYSEESYEQGSPIKYVIYYMGTYITKEQKCTPSYILTFPTEETRDAFYKNFKEEIENCKELL